MRVVLTVFLCLFVVGPVSAANILVNPGFESGGLGPWYNDEDFGSVEPWNVTNTDAQSGSFSATNDGNLSIRQDFAAIAATSITEVSFWIKQPNSAIFVAKYFYSDATSEEGNIQGLSGSDWEFFDLTSELDITKQLTGFAIFGYAGDVESRSFLDNVLIDAPDDGTTVPEPSSILLLSLGAATFALVRRQRA
jgi:hypothetical protein